MSASTDLNDIVVFARVVQAGSFTAAGKLLELPKSTVSRKLSALEARLGTRLLQRTTRSIALTEAGRTYHEHCLRILAEVEASERAMISYQDEPRGLLRVTAALRLRFLGDVFAELLRKYPELRVELVCTDRNIAIVEEGFDMAIRAGTLEDSSLIARRLGHVEQVLVASPAYLLRHGEPEHPRELRRHQGLLFGSVKGGSAWTLRRGDEQVPASPEPRLVANEFDVIHAAALAGHGVAMLAEIRVREELAAGRLRRVMPEWRLPEVPLHALYPSAQHLAPKVAALVGVMLERVAAR
jgi:DNA-binding transcriptional LysR family regulator